MTVAVFPEDEIDIINRLERRVEALEIATSRILHDEPGSVDGAVIEHNTITEDHINVNSLSAISGQMGSLTIDDLLTIGPAGTIRTAVGSQITEVNAGGIKSYDANTPNAPTFNLSSTTGILTAKMVIQTGTQMPLGFIAGGNKLPNSSGERPDLTATPWSGYSSNGSAAVAIVDEATAGFKPHHGLRMFRVTHTGGSTHGIGISNQSERIVIQPSTKYVISAYIRPTVTRTFQLYGWQANSAGSGIANDTSAAVSCPAGQWTRISHAFTSNAAAATMAVYVASVAAPGTNEVFYIDSIQAEEGEIPTAYAPRSDEVLPGSITVNELAADSVSATKIQADAVRAQHILAGEVTASKVSFLTGGRNMVPNSIGALGWVAPWSKQPVAWHWNPNSAGQVQAITNAPGFGNAYRILASGADWAEGIGMPMTNLNSSFVFRAGRKYTASVYVSTEHASISPVQLVLGAASANVVSVQSANLTPTWQRLTVTWTPTADVAASAVYIGVRTSTPMNAWYYATKFQLEEGDLASEWTQYIDATVIDGTSITAANIRTNATNTRVEMNDTYGFSVWNSGAMTAQMKAGRGGLDLLTSGSATPPDTQKIRFMSALNSGGEVSGEVASYAISGASSFTYLRARAVTGGSGTSAASIDAFESGTGSTGSQVQAVYSPSGTSYVNASAGGTARRVIQSDGTSDFVQVDGAPGNAKMRLRRGTQNVTFSSGASPVYTINHSLGTTPVWVAVENLFVSGVVTAVAYTSDYTSTSFKLYVISTWPGASYNNATGFGFNWVAMGA